jgi:hypothetical protein
MLVKFVVLFPSYCAKFGLLYNYGQEVRHVYVFYYY